MGLEYNRPPIAFPAIGADGKTQLWIQSLDSLTPKPLSIVDVSQNIDTLFWSPDSRFLAFAVNQPTPQLKRVDAAGGPVQIVATLPGFVGGGSWAADGTILLGSLTGIVRVPPGGGTPALVTKVDPARKELAHIGAMVLPDGRHFLYSRGGAPGTRGVFIGALDVAADAQSTMPLLTTDFGATFAAKPGARDAGWLLFVRDGSLIAQPFDASTQKLSGEPAVVVEGVGTINGTGAGGAYYSVSP